MLRGWIIFDEEEPRLVRTRPKYCRDYKNSNEKLYRKTEILHGTIESSCESLNRIPRLSTFVSAEDYKCIFGDVRMSKVHMNLTKAGLHVHYMSDGLYCPVAQITIRKASTSVAGAPHTLKHQVLVDGFLSVEYEKVKKILNGLCKMNLENVEFSDSKVL